MTQCYDAASFTLPSFSCWLLRPRLIPGPILTGNATSTVAAAWLPSPPALRSVAVTVRPIFSAPTAAVASSDNPGFPTGAAQERRRSARPVEERCLQARGLAQPE